MDEQRKIEDHRTRSFMEYTVHSQNRNISSLEVKLSYAMTTNHWQDFSMERMSTTKKTDRD